MDAISYAKQVEEALTKQRRPLKWLQDLLGISRTALYNKMNGTSSFTEPEKYVIKNELFADQSKSISN